jgi:hypothetical protein
MSWLIVIGMLVPPEVTVTEAPVSEMLVRVWTDHPVWDS